MSHPATLLHRESGPDLDLTVVDKPGSGIWTVISHADGWDRLITPSGAVIDVGPGTDTRGLANEIIQDCINHIW